MSTLCTATAPQVLLVAYYFCFVFCLLLGKGKRNILICHDHMNGCTSSSLQKTIYIQNTNYPRSWPHQKEGHTFQHPKQSFDKIVFLSNEEEFQILFSFFFSKYFRKSPDVTCLKANILPLDTQGGGGLFRSNLSGIYVRVRLHYLLILDLRRPSTVGSL